MFRSIRVDKNKTNNKKQMFKFIEEYRLFRNLIISLTVLIVASVLQILYGQVTGTSLMWQTIAIIFIPMWQHSNGRLWIEQKSVKFYEGIIKDYQKLLDDAIITLKDLKEKNDQK